MPRRREWVPLALVATVALVAGACSGGTTKNASSKSNSPAASSASPASPGATPAGTDNGSTPGAADAGAAGSAATPNGSPASAAPSGSNSPSAPGSAPAAASAGKNGAAGGARTASAAANGPSGTKGAPAGTPVAPAIGAPATPGAPGGQKANYASDVGVTPDTIKLGTINMTSATRSLGPAIAGVQEQNLDAAVKYINRIGGVAGRRLQLLTCDDGGDVARGRACYEKLKGQVFALIPSITWLTDVIHDRMVKDKIPWLSWGWFKSEYQDPWMFPCHANGKREAIAAADWTAKVIRPATVGIMYLNVTEDIAAKDDATKELEKYGVKVVTTVAQEWDSADESQHVLAMRASSPDFVMSFSWPTPVAKFMHDAQTQHWAPKLGYIANHLTGDPGYGPIFGDYIKDKTYTITSWGVPTGPDPNNPEGDTAEQRLLVQELLRTNGREYQGFKWRYAGMHHITQSGWVCTRILAKAAAEMGPDLTREGLRKILESRSWDSGLGVNMYWPASSHEDNPYSYNREFIYKWITASDGGWDLKRIIPDPVFDCRAPNIPAGAHTDC